MPTKTNPIPSFYFQDRPEESNVPVMKAAWNWLLAEASAAGGTGAILVPTNKYFSAGSVIAEAVGPMQAGLRRRGCAVLDGIEIVAVTRRTIARLDRIGHSVPVLCGYCSSSELKLLNHRSNISATCLAPVTDADSSVWWATYWSAQRLPPPEEVPLPIPRGCEHHYLEASCSREVREFIQTHAQDVLGRLRDPLNCLNASITWLQELQASGLPGTMLGRQGLGARGGFRCANGGVADHHFLAVGAELALFDPTASQFAGEGPVGPERYLVADGSSFTEWRRERLRERAPEEIRIGNLTLRSPKRRPD